MIQFTTQLVGKQAADLCAAHAQGSLATILQDGFAANLMPAKGYASNVSATLLTDLIVSGCPGSGGGGRRLLQHVDVVIVDTNVLMRVEGGITVIDPSRFEFLQYYRNTTIVQQLLGGDAVITILLSQAPPVMLSNGTYISAPPNSTFYGNITITIRNISDHLPGGNLNAINNLVNGRPPTPSDVTTVTNIVADDAFATDKAQALIDKMNNDKRKGQGGTLSPGASAGHRHAIFTINCLTFGTVLLSAMTLR
jgi:hypothetical protein